MERELAGRLDLYDLAIRGDRAEIDWLTQEERRGRVGRRLQTAMGELPVAARVVALRPVRSAVNVAAVMLVPFSVKEPLTPDVRPTAVFAPKPASVSWTR